MRNKMTCCCGHDCARCVTYRATVENNDELRKQAQKFYHEEFGKDIPLEKIRCKGGRSDEMFFMCGDCPWVKCCRERGLDTCSQCADYPCPPLADYIEKYVNKCNQID
ncbi:MAG TPA: DUF3795 domain-containing protein, partial [Clostridiales bacterium]|nr:DUF3795 domain-containing protein [Clostridiales bacterium]